MIAALDAFHTRESRSPFQAGFEPFQRLRLATGHHFHAAIGKIARVTAEAQRLRRVARMRAEADALHATGDQAAQTTDMGIFRHGPVQRSLGFPAAGCV